MILDMALFNFGKGGIVATFLKILEFQIILVCYKSKSKNEALALKLMFIKHCQDFTVVFNFHQLRQLHESLEQTSPACKLSSSSKFFECTYIK
jgi:hypothetical protein